MLRGRRPIPASQHIKRGTYRTDRYGDPETKGIPSRDRSKTQFMRWEPDETADNLPDPIEVVANNKTLFPTRGEKFSYAKKHIRIDVRRHIHPDRYFVTLFDFNEQTMKAVKDAAPKIEIYPAALMLAGDLDDDFFENVVDSESYTVKDDMPHGLINPDFIDILSAAQSAKIAPDCETETVTYTIPEIGELVLTVATIRNLDTLAFKIPRF